MGCKAGLPHASTPYGIFILTLEGWPTKAKEVPSPHEVSLALLNTSQVFECLGNRWSITRNK